jgi:hypothetical protein
MSATVAVALITALSTLIGVAITGYLALLTGRAQLWAQQKSAELDRNEQNVKYVREIRRSVYLGFMNQLTQIEEMLDRNLWLRTGFGKGNSITKGEIIYTATAGMHKLASQLDLVRLEGSSTISEAALKLYSRLDDEVVRLMVLAAAPEAVRDGVLRLTLKQLREVPVLAG